MTAAEKLPTSETVYDYPLADIRDPSIPNYRTTFEGIDELTASVTERGIRIPLVLRPCPEGEGHELAIGARRREAARRAGLTMVPVLIRELTDDEVLEERAIENLQRVNPDPLDEAAAFQLLVKRGHTEQQLADKLGQPLRYVLERLALNTLCKEGREALAKGKMLLGVAILVAGLPNEKVQQDAVAEVTSSYSDHDVMTVSGARDAIALRVLLELGKAPFKLADATLVPEAGACTVCPKRTGHQGNLFSDTEKDDLCLDPVCHSSKLEALYQLRVKQAKIDGQTVLSKKASVAALQSASVSYGTSELVKLDDHVYPAGKKKSLRALFGKELPPITLARDEHSGVAVELVPRAAAVAALKTVDPKAAGADGGTKGTPDAKAKAAREAEKIQAEVRRRVLVGLVENLEDAELVRPGEQALAILQVLCRAAIHSLPPDVRKAVANRRGCPLMVEEGAATSKKGKGKHQQQLTPEQRLEALLPSLDIRQLPGLLLELVIDRAAPGKWSEAHDSYSDACMALGINVAAIEKLVKAERKAKADAKGKSAKPEKAPAKAEPAAKKKAAKKATPRPEHPATGQTVHYIDPTGLSQTGASCGGKVGGSKGIVTDEAEKVTCKSCRRTAALDTAADPEGGDDAEA
jgi:ParB/RepB/Spo0J family partition protein